MGPGTTAPFPWDWSSGSLCLDFCNTAEWHASANPLEHFHSYADLVSWSRSGGIVTEEEAAALLEEASKRPEGAEKILAQAIGLRETIYRIFTRIAQDGEPSAPDLAALNTTLSQAMARARVIHSNGGFAWSWSQEEPVLDKVLWPITRAAADLLTSDRLERVGQCADDRGCGWLFVDSSRNRSRQWCSMDSCGNRAKAKRHYERTKKNPARTSE